MAALHASRFQRLLSLLAAFVLAFSTLGAAPLQKTQVSASAPAAKAKPYAQDHLIVKFKEGSLPVLSQGGPVLAQGGRLKTGDARLDWAMEHAGAARLKPLAVGLGMATAHGKDPAGLGRIYQVDLASGQTVPAAVELLALDPAVEYAEPDYLAHAAAAPDDPRYGEQWGLQAIHIEAAWAVSQGAPATVIAIVDSGIQKNHPDLAANLWTNPGEVAGNGIDEDNNGLKDDVSGWNFVDQNNNPADDSGHGTLVAGIVAAKTGNAEGIAGVCGSCRVMPVKVMNSGGTANYSDIVLGVYYATVKSAKVINLSLGGYANSQALKDAIDVAVAQGIIVVAGAGNDNKNDPFYPAAYENVIAAAGVTQAGARVSTSNYGDWVDVSAPGENLLSTAMGGDYVTVSGSSYAAPFAAGLAGLLKTQHPDWTSAMVRAQLIHTASAMAESGMGAGLVDAARAVQPPQPILSLQSYSTNGIANGRPDFNSDVTLELRLYNDWADASAVSATLSTTDAAVSISSASASFGTILAGASGTNAAPFRFHIGAVGYNHAIPFKLTLSANDGAYKTTLTFSVATRSSEVNVSGTITTSRTWTSDKIYVVTGNLGIAPGVTLTIQPGTVVKFKGNFEFKDGGTLIAAGTEAQPIQFQPYAGVPSWNRLLIDNPSTDAHTGADGSYQSGTILRHVSISGATNGLRCTTATPYLDELTINRGGISCSLGATRLWMTGGQVEGNVTFSGQPATLSGTIVNGSLALGQNAKVRNATISGDLNLQGSAEMTGSTVMNGSTKVGANSSLSGNTFSNAIRTAVTLGANATFTANRVVEGDGDGVLASSGKIEGNLIAFFHGQGLTARSASIRNNTFTGMWGVPLVLTGQPPSELERNNFELNVGTYDLSVNFPKAGANSILARNNWWGTTDAETIQTRVWDFNDGDDNIAQLVFYPPLAAPSQTAPAYVRSVNLDSHSLVGIQPANFTVEFSRPMDVETRPAVSFDSIFSNDWANRAPLPGTQFGLGVIAANNGKIYAIGGENERKSFDTVTAYDPEKNTWTTLANMPTDRIHFGIAAAKNGKIYAIGGELSGKTVDEYDPATNTWTARASMDTPRVRFGAATGNNGKIYAIGGDEKGTVDEYDPVLNTWTKRASMPTPRYNFGVAAIHGKIYTIGGTIGGLPVGTVEAYDPGTDTWTSRTSMRIPRVGFAVAVAKTGKIYKIGGEMTTNVEEYDPLTNTWALQINSPTERLFFGAVTAENGKIYAIGGRDTTVNVFTPPGFYKKDVTGNPKWLDATHFRASYNFSSLSPRGEYRVEVSGGDGTDGLTIPPYTGSGFFLDYPGSITDTTPPLAPAVSAWGDGTLGMLNGSWYSTDLESQVTAYQYAIGTGPGKADVVAWKTTTARSMSQSGLSLMRGVKYYLSVKARNEAGLWSPPGASSAVVNGRVPTPILSLITPDMVKPGSGAFTLTVTGRNFVPSSVVRWNGANLATVYVSPTTLTVQISAEMVAARGSAEVTIFNPTPGGGSSAVKIILIQEFPKVYIPLTFK